MGAVQSARDLNDLVRSRTPADRERLLTAIVELCSHAGSVVRQPQIQETLSGVFMSLVSGAEHEIRALLAEKLSHAEWPPNALINLLACDDIEIARPLIASSPALQDADLIRIMVEATVEHQIEVARRPALGAPVVDAIIGQADPTVLTALAGNDTADISHDAMERLVEISHQVAGMRSPLVRHPRLTSDLAERLYTWVGQSLRAAIVARFRVDEQALDKALAEAVSQAHYGRSAGILTAIVKDDQDVSDQRLIAKLHAAGQLRSSYLLRSLREGKLSLFRVALAVLGDYSVNDVRRALDTQRPELLALACAGVGIDRSAFGTVLGLVRGLNGGLPGGDEARARRAFDAFKPDETRLAGAAFRKAMGGV